VVIKIIQIKTGCYPDSQLKNNVWLSEKKAVEFLCEWFLCVRISRCSSIMTFHKTQIENVNYLISAAEC